MGLDQYAYARNAFGSAEYTAYTKEALAGVTGEEEVQLAYWRKHNRLHGWMEALYVLRGGDEDFNRNEYVTLGSDDIDALEAAIKHRSLPATGGFFFGTDSYEDYEDDWDGTCKSVAEADLEFIATAREWLARGAEVYYTSCW